MHERARRRGRVGPAGLSRLRIKGGPAAQSGLQRGKPVGALLRPSARQPKARQIGRARMIQTAESRKSYKMLLVISFLSPSKRGTVPVDWPCPAGTSPTG